MSASIPPEAQQAAAEGHVIEAIKITREQTGLGLKEAKDAVDAFLHGAQPSERSATGVEVPMDAVSSLWQGELIEAVRRTRAHTGLGLKDAKALVERHLANHPGTNQRFRESAAQRSRGLVTAVKIVLVAAAVLLGYWWLTDRLP